MVYHFEAISKAEYETLQEAISWITLLVAGADNEIDHEETEWAQKLTKIRSYANEDTLHEFYTHVGEDFDGTLVRLITSTLGDAETRRVALEAKIATLNPILAQLPNHVGAAMYQSYITFARHVAEASGGFLGFGSISANEKKVIGLPTLDPIVLIESSDEEE